MIKINRCNPEMLNRKFGVFSASTLSLQKPDTNYVISQMKLFEKQYKRQGLVETFCSNAMNFADKFADNKLYDFAGMIYSNLLKLPNMNPKIKEEIALKALNIAKKQNDPIHILARIVDLKKMYKAGGNRKQFVNLLYDEEKQLNFIVSNYGKSASLFKSHSKATNSIHTYNLRLAMVRVDIAKTLLNFKPKAAERRILQALETFRNYGKESEVGFCEMLLSQIKR